MERLKAIFNFIDAAGRAVVLTENNHAFVIYDAKDWKHLQKGDQVFIEREDGMRRMADWKLRSQ